MISSKQHNFTLKELEKEDEITQARKWKEIIEMKERERERLKTT
jgi:hypothetical protein